MVSERKRKIRELDANFNRVQEQVSEDRLRKRRGLFRRLTAFAFIVVTLSVIAFMTIHTQAQLLEEKNEEKQALQARLEALEIEQLHLEQEIINYNDLDYIAEIARRDYFLSKDREILFKLPKISTD
ncbi:FtsB family cell division protein [Alkalihalobacterium alkalinitrilicum]|uniref:FtsB family cell division protein n=1 Tax=Alkalihalobacterium alkalinitrilicum TaxID=427920 RepID=UPI000994BC49|nr:septum formation initiator family protein [Alkalihalobacterium alkalinitrilicum]